MHTHTRSASLAQAGLAAVLTLGIAAPAWAQVPVDPIRERVRDPNPCQVVNCDARPQSVAILLASDPGEVLRSKAAPVAQQLESLKFVAGQAALAQSSLDLLRSGAFKKQVADLPRGTRLMVHVAADPQLPPAKAKSLIERRVRAFNRVLAQNGIPSGKIAFTAAP